jgi:predicted ribonuclease YlaK
VSGFGLRGQEYQNSDIGDERTFVRGSRTLAVHNCDKWKQKQQSGKKQFSQSCKDVKVYSNIILVEEDSSIGVIRQVVDDRYNVLTLTKLN